MKSAFPKFVDGIPEEKICMELDCMVPGMPVQHIVKRHMDIPLSITHATGVRGLMENEKKKERHARRQF